VSRKTGRRGWPIERNRIVRGPSRTKQVDLSIERADGSVELAMEVKYEPSPLRADLGSPSGARSAPM